MRSKGGSSKVSVLGCTNGLSAIAEVLAVFCPGPAPAARAAAENVAAQTPRYTSLMVMPSTVRPRAGRNGILRAPSLRARLAARFSWRGGRRARSRFTQDPYEHHAGPGRQ